MSVHITVALPRVWAESRFLIRAFLLAMFRLARDKERVMVGSIPSGTLATMRDRAKMAATSHPWPERMPRTKKTPPTRSAARVRILVILMISSCIGVALFSTSFDREAIRPNSVSFPVAKTMPKPFPEATVVPAKRTFFASKISSLASASAILLAGCASPVRAATLT